MNMLKNYFNQGLAKLKARLVNTEERLQIVFDSYLFDQKEGDICPRLEVTQNKFVIADYVKETDELFIDEYISLVKFDNFGCKSFASMYENASVSDDLYEVSDSFFYELIAIRNPHIHTHLSENQVRYRWLYLYVDKLDDVEKFFSIMKPSDVFELMEEHRLNMSDGKKLKQISGVPTDIMEMLDKMEIGKNVVKIQKLLSDGYDANDVRDALSFVAKVCQFSNRTSFGRVFNNEDCVPCNSMLHEICSASEADGKKSLSRVINYALRDAMFFNDFNITNIRTTIRSYRDCYTMMKQYGIDVQLGQNIAKHHFYVSRNFNAMKIDRNEEYDVVAKRRNQHSVRRHDYEIKMPESIKELVRIGIAYNNCLPTYVNRIIDDDAIVYSIYKNGQDIPPVTFELSSNYDVIQVKTFNDMDVDDPEMLAIVRDFVRTLKNAEKGLKAA